MFKLTKSPTFKVRDIGIETMDDKGRVLKEPVHAEYNRLDEDELTSLEDTKGAEVLRQVLVNVEGLTDENNQAIPFNEDTKAALLRISPAVYALATAFWQASRKGRAKN